MVDDPIAPVRSALDRPGDGSSDFDLTPHMRPGARALTPAAVLIALEPSQRGLRLWLTKRASRLRHHPGQIALPGGRIDPGDPGPEAAALREAAEEIGLPPACVDVLGRLPDHATVTGFRVTPVVARITARFDPRAEAGEVAEVFAVPFAHLADPANYRVEARRWQGRDRRYYTVPYGPYYIWGATARILLGLAWRLAR